MCKRFVVVIPNLQFGNNLSDLCALDKKGGNLESYKHLKH